MIQSHIYFIISFFKSRSKREEALSWPCKCPVSMSIHSGSVWNSPLKIKFFSLKKFSLQIWMKLGSLLTLWSLSLIFFFSSSLAFFLCICCYQTLGTNTQRGMPKPLWVCGCGMPKGGVCGTPKGEERERGREGAGAPKRAWSLLVWILWDLRGGPFK